MGEATFFPRFEARLKDGLRLVQVREKNISREALKRSPCACSRWRAATARKVLLNSDIGSRAELGADGVHLTAAQLGARVRNLSWCGASCHSAEELRRAEALGADFAVLGPVRATPSHPDSAPLGWTASGRWRGRVGSGVRAGWSRAARPGGRRGPAGRTSRDGARAWEG